jgi:hypothetical protein
MDKVPAVSGEHAIEVEKLVREFGPPRARA